MRSYHLSALPIFVLVLLGTRMTAQNGSHAGSNLKTLNTPRFIESTGVKDLGTVDPQEVIDVTLWLELHNRADLDTLAKDLYDPASSSYRKWLSQQEFVARYAPTAAEYKQVASYLRAQGFEVTGADSSNFYVRARASIDRISNTFRVSLHRYQLPAGTYRSNTGDPVLDASISGLVRFVSGLDDYPLTASLADVPFSGQSFSAVCFPGTKSETVIGAPGEYPYLPLSGNFYVSGPNCGYSPEAIQDAYKLKPLYKAGYDGTGQTIAIIDWCGSPTIRKDVNSFSTRFGLPPLTPSNFRIIDFPKPSACSGVNPQINRDVEWAHAIAPGAEIALVIAMSSAPQDVDQAEYHAIITGVGNVLSGSYGFQEHYQSAAEVLNMNLLNEIAAVFGISANFPVGDSPSDDFWWVWAPATSPYATAIGGTTLALNANHTRKWETGWGSYGIQFDVSDSDASTTVIYSGGSTGQTSEVFPQPPYQKGLPYSNRAAPDIAWVADAFTGALVEFTPAGSSVTELKAYGGTGLACTMFSALWAIANQEAGVPLGQAAPYLYSMPKGAITDVLEVGSKTNPDARIYFSPTYSEDLTSLLTDSMYAAIWNHAGSVDMVFVGYNLFASPAGPGWDFLTGLGTPNVPVFAEYFNPGR